MSLSVTLLGAGRTVGRSCILLHIGGRRVLLDCGITPGRSPDDADYLPDFGLLSGEDRPPITEYIDLVIISHFHADHIGALCYLTEVLGYRGPILMSSPTRAIGPLIIKDFARTSGRGGGRSSNTRYLTPEAVDACFNRVTCMQLRERVVIKDIVITSYYAGHVLGAIMVFVECGGRSAFYTGDFTMVTDHYLSAAKVPLGLRPDIMITEATCCTTIRSSKRAKESELCRKIQESLEAGHKVLMPIFMVGRAQEMCLLCERHWEREQLDYPIYIVRGMAEVALSFFRLFASWGSERVRKAEDPFSFKHMKFCDLDDILNNDAPMVIFAGPAMLQGGSSLRLFQQLAPQRGNLLVFAGYCVPGTLGNQVQAGLKTVQVEEGVTVDVKCEVDYMSHSDHTDSRGISQLITQVAPKTVVLVHGVDKYLDVYQPIVERRLGVPCVSPRVGETMSFEADREDFFQILVSPALVLRARPVPAPSMPLQTAAVCVPASVDVSGVLVRRKRGAEEAFEFRDAEEPGLGDLGLTTHRIRFRHESRRPLPWSVLRDAWECLRRELDARSERYIWNPREPRFTGDRGDFRLSLLADTRCSVRGSGGGGRLVRLAVEWTQADEGRCGAIADFIDSLEAAAETQ